MVLRMHSNVPNNPLSTSFFERSACAIYYFMRGCAFATLILASCQALNLPIVQVLLKQELRSEIVVGKDLDIGAQKISVALQGLGHPEMLHHSNLVNIYSDEMLKRIIQSENCVVLLLFSRHCRSCKEFEDGFSSIQRRFQNQYVFAQAACDDIPKYTEALQQRWSGVGVKTKSCLKCSGSGGVTCPLCSGVGHLNSSALYTTMCSSCGGKGQVRCNVCGGRCQAC